MMSKRQPRQPDYFAYLLRLWRVNGDEHAAKPIWRASLEDPQTGKQQGFGSLETMFDYLVIKTGGVVNQPASQAESEAPPKKDSE